MSKVTPPDPNRLKMSLDIKTPLIGFYDAPDSGQKENFSSFSSTARGSRHPTI